MSTQALSDDARRLLTPQELEALGEDYDPEQDNAAALAAAGLAPTAEPGAETQAPAGDAAATATPAKPATATAEEEAEAAAAGAAAGAGGEKATEQATTQAGTQPAPASDPEIPAYKVDLPADFDAQMQANKDARKDLRKQYESGDIDQAEYDEKLDLLDDKRLELKGLEQRAEIARDMTEQAHKAAWVNAINTFCAKAAKDHSIGIVDYANDPSKSLELDTFIGVLAKSPEAAGKPRSWFLEEAHKRVVAVHRIPTSARPATPAKRQPNVEHITPTLAHVPGASGVDANDDEFAHLDSLTGLDAERAVAALPPEKLALYLKRQ